MKTMSAIFAAILAVIVFAACNPSGGIDEWQNKTDETFTVTFNANGGTSTPAPQTVVKGGKVTEPVAITKSGFTFGDWYKEATLTNQWNFATDTVTANITLYAKWNTIPGTTYFDVTFNTNGGTPMLTTKTVAVGNTVTEPEGVNKTGHTLGGWYTDDGTFEYRWDFANRPVTANITLYAKWDIKRYTVTFNADGETPAPAQQIVEHDGKVTQPTGVTKIGYTLNGWYAEPAFTNRWNFTTDTVTANITLYAKWIKHLPPDVIEMELIKAGTFTMGSSDSQDNFASPPHQVTLTQDFYMGKYEVTQEQYQAVMGTNPSGFPTGAAQGETQGRRPVERVSWYDALVFCNTLSMIEGLVPAYRINNSTDPAAWGTTVPTSSNAIWNAVTIDSNTNGYRLPTEAQWEYACRAGKETPWHTASETDSDLDNYAWYDSNSNSRTHEVGLKFPNAWGLYDMHGNVLELCWDRYGTYSSSAQTDPIGAASGTSRVFRSGSWYYSGRATSSAFRFFSDPYYRSNFLGFRLVRPSN